MTLDERKQYLIGQLNTHKARAFDLQQQLNHEEDLIKVISGAMETIDDLAAEQKAQPAS